MKKNKNVLFILAIFVILTINIKVNALEFIDRVDIYYDVDAVKISPAYTYEEVRGQINDNWSVAPEANYSIGNNNVWMYYCPTDEACDISDRIENYDIQVNADRFNYVAFEIYANPHTSNSVSEGYDFDEENLSDIAVWVNDEERNDAIVTHYNEALRCITVYVPVEVDTSPLVKSIEISSDTDNVVKGATLAFTADIDYYGEDCDGIEWSIFGNTSLNTTISDSGLLSVALDEESDTIIVTATSTYDSEVYADLVVFVQEEELAIDSVTINTSERTVVRGGRQYFNVVVTGTAPHDVLWNVTGNDSENTYVTNNGILYVGADETANQVTLTVTSTYDDTKSYSAVINTPDRTYINKVEISYDKNEAKATTLSTYGEVRAKFNQFWSLPDLAHYGKGNDNVWIYFCPTSERCNEDLDSDYEAQVDATKYTYAMFEIYAKPTGNNVDNPIYDFDAEDLENIEIWVNGVKREDVLVRNYNGSWRAIDVFVPIEVTKEKMTQVLSFYAPERIEEYGNESFINHVTHSVGDGVITYTSLNSNVAEIDSMTGEVTIKGVGTTIITATAAETENYSEKSISYPLTVNRRYIYPTYEIDNYTYTGSAIRPVFTISTSGVNLVSGVDYTLQYSNNINVGTADVLIKSVASSNYTFEDITAHFYISRKTLTEDMVIVPEKVAYYEDRVVTVNLKVVNNGKTLTNNTDYTYSLTNEDGEIGEYVTVTVYGSGNFGGTVQKEVLIASKEEVLALVKPVIRMTKWNNNAFLISWDAQNAEETYYVYRSTDNKKWTKIGETTSDSYVSGGLTYGKTYYYAVYAKNELSKTGWSNIIHMKLVPDKVTNLTVTGIGTTLIRMAWDKVGVTGYQIQRSTNNKRWSTIKTITKNSTITYTNTKRSANTTYYYRVRAYKLVGRTKVYGAWSNVIKVRTAPKVPKLTVTVRDYNLLSVNIGSVAGATSYEIYKSETKDGAYEKIGTVAKSGAYLDGNVTLGSTYYYKVKSCNSEHKCSVYTSVVARKATPRIPSFTLKSPAIRKIRITLSKLDNVDGYRIYRATSKNGKYTLIKELTNEEQLFFDNKTSRWRRYYYKVRSYKIIDGKKIYSDASASKNLRSR